MWRALPAYNITNSNQKIDFDIYLLYNLWIVCSRNMQSFGLIHVAVMSLKAERIEITRNICHASKRSLKQRSCKEQTKEAVMISQQNNNHASTSGDEKLQIQRKRKNRRISNSQGYLYMHTVGWICRREKQRRKSDKTGNDNIPI